MKSPANCGAFYHYDLFNNLINVFIAAALSILFLIISIVVWQHEQYVKGSYYLITKNSYWSIKSNKGKNGEYLIYRSLRHLEKNGSRFLFNVFIPKPNGETTEIDVLLISTKGLFVFESKNYSGWIFGNDTHNKWTQVFPNSTSKNHKFYFYNPVAQNASHVKYLERLIGANIFAH